MPRHVGRVLPLHQVDAERHVQREPQPAANEQPRDAEQRGAGDADASEVEPGSREVAAQGLPHHHHQDQRDGVGHFRPQQQHKERRKDQPRRFCRLEPQVLQQKEQGQRQQQRKVDVNHQRALDRQRAYQDEAGGNATGDIPHRGWTACQVLCEQVRKQRGCQSPEHARQAQNGRRPAGQASQRTLEVDVEWRVPQRPLLALREVAAFAHPALVAEWQACLRHRPGGEGEVGVVVHQRPVQLARDEQDVRDRRGEDECASAAHRLSLWEWIKPRAARVRGAYIRRRLISYAPLTPALSQRERELPFAVIDPVRGSAG